MKVDKINTNINFNGYKNIVCESYKDFPMSTSFLATKLNNIGTPDLDVWHAIQKRFFPNQKLKDVVSVKMFEIEGKNPTLILNNREIKPSKMEIGNEEEKFGIKAATFIASLTKRIMEDNKIIKDRELPETVETLVDEMYDLIGVDKFTSHYAFMNIVAKDMPPQPIAYRMNKATTEIMLDYFS